MPSHRPSQVAEQVVRFAPVINPRTVEARELDGISDWNHLRSRISKIDLGADFISALMARNAQRKVMMHWLETGGAGSRLGLPLDASFPVLQSGSDYITEFRGGTVHINSDTGVVSEDLSGQVVVTFEGFGLEIRQEDGDEIFGSIQSQIGTTGYQKACAVPEQHLGPGGNNRVAQLGIVLYEGPPVNLNILLTLFEHDHGDRTKVRNEVKARFKEIFDKAQETVGGMGLGATTVATEVMQAEDSSTNGLKEWLVDGVGGFIADFLGLGDDVYNPVGFTIRHEEMRNPGPMRQYRCSSDPKILNFNISRMTTCTDDGGDLGQISALFSVRPL
jgi:hypothetical protein